MSGRSVGRSILYNDENNTHNEHNELYLSTKLEKMSRTRRHFDSLCLLTFLFSVSPSSCLQILSLFIFDVRATFSSFRLSHVQSGKLNFTSVEMQEKSIAVACTFSLYIIQT